MNVWIALAEKLVAAILASAKYQHTSCDGTGEWLSRPMKVSRHNYSSVMPFFTSIVVWVRIAHWQMPNIYSQGSHGPIQRRETDFPVALYPIVIGVGRECFFWFYRRHVEARINMSNTHIVMCALSAVRKEDSCRWHLHYSHLPSTYHVHELSTRHMTTTNSTTITATKREIIVLSLLFSSSACAEPQQE